jgi:hypothetical protein
MSIRKNYLFMLFLYLLALGCCEASHDSAPYGFTIKKDGKTIFGGDKSKINISFLEDKTSKPYFNLIKDYDGKDSVVFVSILPPSDKSMVKYLIVNDLAKRKDTLSLFYSVSKCSVTFESSLLNGKKGTVTTINYAVIFDVD